MTQAHTHEYAADVPRMYPNDPRVTLAVSVHGGGTLGRSYARNGWDYAVIVDGTELITGSDLRSGAAATHAEMTRTLASFLAAAGESLHLRGERSEYRDEYFTRQREFLEAEYERLSLFALDSEDQD